MNRTAKRVISLAGARVFFCLSSIFAAGQAESPGLQLIASTSIVADVVRNIAGDTVPVTGLMGPSQDPHGYEPTPRDMAAVERADILFLSGLGLEEGLERVLQNVGTGRIVEVSREIVPEEKDEHEGPQETEGEEDHHHGEQDPHTWMSPINVISWTSVIEQALIEEDPVHKDIYNRNAEAYRKELQALHQDIREIISTIPAEKRVMVTDHNLFGYFAHEYGLEVRGSILPNLSTTSEASAKHLAGLIGLLEGNGIHSLFIGDTAGKDIVTLAEAIKDELGYKVTIVTLLTGSLQEKGQPGDSYLGYMRFNARKIAEGLRGN